LEDVEGVTNKEPLDVELAAELAAQGVGSGGAPQYKAFSW